MPYKAAPISERFLRHVDKTATCWLWTGSRPGFGYGKFVVKKGLSPEMAHRVSYRLFVDDIPHGMQVLHQCDVPSCVNPAHLFLGTQSDNMHDKIRKGRWKYSPRNQSGGNNPNAVLTDAQVSALMADLRAGERPVTTARKYGIQYRTLWAIRKREREKTSLY